MALKDKIYHTPYSNTNNTESNYIQTKAKPLSPGFEPIQSSTLIKKNKKRALHKIRLKENRATFLKKSFLKKVTMIF